MSEQLREALSAAVDGEASDFELRRVFDEMAKDESLARAWQSYHLIKQAAQDQNVQDVSSMSERIWASLDAEQFLERDIVQEEPLAEAVEPVPARRWGLAGGAVAAAVALGVVVFGGFLDSVPASNGSIPGSALVDNSTPLPAPEMAQTAQTIIGGAATPQPQLVQAAQTPDSLQPYADARQSISSQSDAAGYVQNEGYDYGPGFVPFSQLSPADQARSDGYFLHHVQHQAMNNDNVLSFVKMISYPQ